MQQRQAEANSYHREVVHHRALHWRKTEEPVPTPVYFGNTRGGYKQMGKEEGMRRHSDQIISTQSAVKTLRGNLPKTNFNEIFKGADAH